MISPTPDTTTSETPSLNQGTGNSSDLRALAAAESPVTLLLAKLEANDRSKSQSIDLWRVGIDEMCQALFVKSAADEKLLKGGVGQGFVGTTDVFGVRKFQRELGDGGLLKVSDFYFQPDGKPFRGEICITDSIGNVARISVNNGRAGAYYNGASHMTPGDSPRSNFIYNELHGAAVGFLKA